MSSKILGQIGNFQHARAFELLKLVEEAHKRYNDLYPGKKSHKRMFDHVTPASEAWITKEWETDCSQKIQLDYCANRAPYSGYTEITDTPYEVLCHLVFTQTVWSITDLKNGFKRKNLFGFIARKLGTDDLYVVFRGTANLGEWISNTKFIQQSYTTVKSHDTEGETHWGFRRTYDRPEHPDSKSKTGKILWVTRLFDCVFLRNASSLRDTVENTLKEHCSKNKEKVTIYVTGHSLGGALATLATAHIKKLIVSGDISAHYPILYSFASPRVGDDDFSKAFDDLECYRIANSEDLVPKIPIPTLLPIAGRLPARNGILTLLTRWLNEKLNFQHVGLPLYFTLSKKTISDNHTLPVYFEALKPILSKD